MKIKLRNTVKKALVAVFITTVPSCCQKKDCGSIDRINEIRLVNFMEDESDSIIILAYSSRSGFTKPVDSFFLSANINSDGAIIFVPGFINIHKDYKLILSGSDEYTLTDIETHPKECNSCFPWGHTYYEAVKSYSVNNSIQFNEAIVINK
jgi:hypothetical protein